MQPVLVIDNYDSFTYNLVQLLYQAGQQVVVRQNDACTLAQVGRYNHILLSPGPGLPENAGIMPQVIKTYGGSKKLLGVCLGMQGIAEAYGGSLYNLPQPTHGVARNCVVVQPVCELFEGCGTEFMVGRYHSWVVNAQNMPECLRITAYDNNGHIMALKHRQFKVWGVQFHPESVLSQHGLRIIQNWLNA